MVEPSPAGAENASTRMVIRHAKIAILPGTDPVPSVWWTLTDGTFVAFVADSAEAMERGFRRWATTPAPWGRSAPLWWGAWMIG
jgi:hypothetical protein